MALSQILARSEFAVAGTAGKFHGQNDNAISLGAAFLNGTFFFFLVEMQAWQPNYLNGLQCPCILGLNKKC